MHEKEKFLPYTISCFPSVKLSEKLTYRCRLLPLSHTHTFSVYRFLHFCPANFSDSVVSWFQFLRDNFSSLDTILCACTWLCEFIFNNSTRKNYLFIYIYTNLLHFYNLQIHAVSEQSLTIHSVTWYSKRPKVWLNPDVTIYIAVEGNNPFYLASITLQVSVLFTDHRHVYIYTKHVCKFNTINLRPHKFYNLDFNFVALNRKQLFSCTFYRLKYFSKIRCF